MIHLVTPTTSTGKLVDRVQQRRHKSESTPGNKLKRYEVIDDLMMLGFVLDRAIVLMQAGRLDDAKKLLENTIKKHLAA